MIYRSFPGYLHCVIMQMLDYWMDVSRLLWVVSRVVPGQDKDEENKGTGVLVGRWLLLLLSELLGSSPWLPARDAWYWIFADLMCWYFQSHFGRLPMETQIDMGCFLPLERRAPSLSCSTVNLTLNHWFCTSTAIIFFFFLLLWHFKVFHICWS